MDDELAPLLVEIRADTAGFASDVARMRASFDGQLLDGFARAGDVLERGLLSAIRKGRRKSCCSPSRRPFSIPKCPN
ncbi:hypothetical protein GCM10022600_01890 [Qipengyuania pelagi]|uniref:Uncharacterized protein n=1 Tax=Qipengyuania pelagi TaxID=994320 RepID=A0A844Y8X7_9SPHN|nr:hypothetical protein [Qipengyuania pelagi]